MNIFSSTGLSEGLLTAVFDAYVRRVFPDTVWRRRTLALFYDETFTVITDAEKAARVERTGKETFGFCSYCLAQCWLGRRAETPILLFRYIRKAIDAPRSIETNLPLILMCWNFRAWKRVDWERVRLLQFIRFQKAADGTFFAAVEPERMLYLL